MKAIPDKLHLVLLSIHGLIRGHDLELGRDADTGGQTKYVVELARALGEHPRVGRVDLMTRRVVDPQVSDDYAVPIEPLGEGVQIVRIDCGEEGYIPKEELWDCLDNFADNALAYLREEKLTPHLIHSHYADAGYVGTYLAGQLGVPLVHTGHSLGRVKRRRLLAGGLSGNRSKKQYNMSRRIAAEETTLGYADLVITSTQQEVESQYGLYDYYRPEQMRSSRRGSTWTGSSRPRETRRTQQIYREICRFLARTGQAHDPGPVAARPAQEHHHPGGRLRVLAAAAGNRPTWSSSPAPGTTSRRWTRGRRRSSRRSCWPSIATICTARWPIPSSTEPEDVSGPLPPGRLSARRLRQSGADRALRPDPAGGRGQRAADRRHRRRRSRGHHRQLPQRRADRPAGHRKHLDGPERHPGRRVALAGTGGQRPGGGASALFLAGPHRSLSGGRSSLWCPGRPPCSPQPQAWSGRFRDRAIFTDLDKSLLGDPTALRRFIEVIRENRKRATFGIVTGRRLNSALRVLRKHGIPQPDVLITSLGTDIYYAPNLTQDTHWRRAHRPALESPGGPAPAGRPARPETPTPERAGCLQDQLLLRSRPGSPPEEITSLLLQGEQTVNILVSFGQFLDIVPVRASKGAALRWFADQRDVPLERILAVGGSGADEDMMRGNTLAAVVANRHDEELSELAEIDRIFFAKSAHAAGILEAMEHYDFFGACRVPES